MMQLCKLSGTYLCFYVKKFIWHIRSKDNSRRLIIYSFFADRILAVSDFCKKNLPLLFSNKIKVIRISLELQNYLLVRMLIYLIFLMLLTIGTETARIIFRIINQTFVLKKKLI